MWIDSQEKLVDHIEKSRTLQIESLVIAEWNMNDFQEIENYGTYRHSPSSSVPVIAPLTYVKDADSYYKDAEKSFFTYSNFVTDDDEPVLFEKEDVDRKLYFNLKDCFDSFRPRSGINKVLYFGNQIIDNLNNQYIDNVKSAKRPRYYMSSRYDNFKYWNSYRNQIINNALTEVGISTVANPINKPDGSIIGYYINDTAPFVVYEKPIPTNRIDPAGAILNFLPSNSLETLFSEWALKP